MKVGIHRTGGYVSGEKIEQEGLYLTGHISSGAVVTSNRETIENTLERNVSFYDSPGIAIKAIYDGGTYKNSNEKADIMLIGIPKDKFENNDRNLIETIDGQKTLKKDYVLGYVSINNKTKLIEKISSNSYLKNEIKNKENGGERNEF